MPKSNLLIQEPPLQVLPSLAIAIGLNEAIVLQQLHYWLGNKTVGAERDGHKWIFNTYEEWKDNFPFWSVSTIQRIFSNLEGQRIIISEQLDKHNHDMRKFYRIDYEVLRMMHDSNLTSSKTPQCNDDNRTTETTTETTNISGDEIQKIKTSADRTITKRGDLIDGLRDLYQMPGAKKAVLKEYIASQIKVRLSLNSSGRDAESFIDYAALCKKSNQDIDVFITWWIANFPDRAYWSFRRMEQQWDAAFIAPLVEDSDTVEGVKIVW